jgi:RimJ/RimL family protein N-acetyltransferase
VIPVPARSRRHDTERVTDVISTARLVLRPLTLADVDAVHAIHRHADVMRYVNGGRPESRPEVEAVLRAHLGNRWAVIVRSSGHLVGWVGARPARDDTSDRELGYRFDRASWGHGLATEAVRAVVDVAFAELAARRVWAQTMAVNVRSRRVLERCGLHLVRTFHLDWPQPIAGTEEGDVEYALERPRWDRARRTRDVNPLR